MPSLEAEHWYVYCFVHYEPLQSSEEAFDQIREIIDSYSYVAIHSEFPGIVARPIMHSEYAYNTVKANVDLVHLLQLGLTFANGRGEPPPASVSPATFQFNFHFNPP